MLQIPDFSETTFVSSLFKWLPWTQPRFTVLLISFIPPLTLDCGHHVYNLPPNSLLFLPFVLIYLYALITESFFLPNSVKYLYIFFCDMCYVCHGLVFFAIYVLCPYLSTVLIIAWGLGLLLCHRWVYKCLFKKRQILHLYSSDSLQTRTELNALHVTLQPAATKKLCSSFKRSKNGFKLKRHLNYMLHVTSKVKALKPRLTKIRNSRNSEHKKWNWFKNRKKWEQPLCKL